MTLLVCDACLEPVDMTDGQAVKLHNRECAGRHFSEPSPLRHPQQLDAQ